MIEIWENVAFEHLIEDGDMEIRIKINTRTIVNNYYNTKQMKTKWNSHYSIIKRNILSYNLNNIAESESRDSLDAWITAIECALEIYGSKRGSETIKGTTDKCQRW